MQPVDLLASGFDAAAYLRENADLAAARLGPLDAASHFLACGLSERRPAPIQCGLADYSRQIAATSDASVSDHVRAAAAWVTQQYSLADPRPSDLLYHLGRCESLRPLVAIGDSHLRAYMAQPGVNDAGFMPFPLLCSAGSAQGLSNPGSTSGYGNKISIFLNRAIPSLAEGNGAVMFKFGQVDIEFVLHFARLRQNAMKWESDRAESFISDIVRRYVSFLKPICKIANQASVEFCVAGIFPPTLSDHAVRSGYVNGHVASLNGHANTDELAQALARMEFPTLSQRTALHRRFNDVLRCEMAGSHFSYIDDFDPLLDNDTISSVYYDGHAGTDHHIITARPELRSAIHSALNNRSIE